MPTAPRHSRKPYVNPADEGMTRRVRKSRGLTARTTNAHHRSNNPLPQHPSLKSFPILNILVQTST